MKKYIIFVILFFVSFIVSAQTILPFSRSDSSSIQENNKLHQEYLLKDNLMEASRYLDLNAVLYWKHNYFDTAIVFYNKSLVLNEQLGNLNGIAGINSNLALIYADKGDYLNSYEYFEKTLSVRKMNNEKIGIISALINESVVLNKLNRYDESVSKLEEALSLAQELNDEEQMRSIYGMLSETYQKAGNTDKAMYYYEYYKTFNDYVTQKVITETNEKYEDQLLQKQLLELENQYNELKIQNQNLLISKQKTQIGDITNEQQNLIDSLDEVQMSKKIIEQQSKLQELVNDKLMSDKKKQQTVIFIILAAFIISLGLLAVIFFMFRQKNKLNKVLLNKNQIIYQQKDEIIAQRDELLETNKLLDEKNNMVLSSIRYAKGIQKAILQSGEKLENITTKSFNIFMPRDIVSGDFYYFREVNNKKFIVIGDCTGHGVPGAFLTLLGVNFLNTIIFDEKIYSPDIILSRLDQKYKFTLDQEKSSVSDGMDVAICVIDNEKKTIEYSGARNPIIVAKGNNIEHIKGTKSSIGYIALLDNKNKKTFEKKSFEYTNDTWIYMFSDGITDMFNIDHKKYMIKRLIEKITQNTGLSANKQLTFFENEINSWQEGVKQIDDIIFIGFKP